MINYSRRQLLFHATDQCNPKLLQRIAEHFHVGNSRACHFALFYAYGIQGKDMRKIVRMTPTQSHAIFMFFEPKQMMKATSLAAEHGISFNELCKRAILQVVKLIEDRTLRIDDPKVREFFREPAGVSV